MLSATNPSLMIVILSRQWLVCLGLQEMLEGRATVQMVVPPYQWRIPDGSPTGNQARCGYPGSRDRTRRHWYHQQIRESAPTSKIVLLCGFEDHARTREAFAAGVEGIILTVQPPTVMLAMLEALYAPAQPKAYGERDGTVGLDLAPPALKTKSNADASPLAWPNALTEREREIIQLVGQGLSNKDIAYKLSISDSTVRHHMTNIFNKVGVPNRQNLLIHTYQFRSTPI